MGHGGHHGGMSMDAMVADMRNRFIVAAVLSVPVLLWSPIGREVFGFTVPAPFGLRDDVFSLLLSLPVIFYSAWIFFDGAYRALKARTLDMMVLVAVGVGAGWLYSVGVTLTGSSPAPAATCSTRPQRFSPRSCCSGIGSRCAPAAAPTTPSAPCSSWRPRRPWCSATGRNTRSRPRTSRSVTCCSSGPGRRSRSTALVEGGDSEVDESMVTGESLPVVKSPGSEVIGASVNVSGTLRVRATKVGADTALAQIVALVQEAQNSKAPGQRLADRAAFWLVLVALIGGGLTFAVWLASGAGVQTALLFAITVVVITCPDALGLATPTAIMVGTGLGAKRGVLFKNATALETAARIDTVVMDKTGTLTKGEPEVTDVIVDDARRIR